MQQHQFISQHSDNKANVNKDNFTSDSLNFSCPAPNLDVNSQTIPSPPHTTNKPAPQALEQDAQEQLITELRGLSEMSVSGMNDVSNADKGSRILQEIKKKRKHSKLGENKKIMEDWWHKKETRRSTDDDLSSTSHSHDVKRALKQCKHSKGLGADEKLMGDLSSWHKQETGKIVNDLCSNTSDSQEVTRLLISLKETIDAIFITTIQRASKFVGVSSTSRENNVNRDHEYDSPDQKALLMQIKNTEEERDSLYLQNVTLQNEVVNLKSRLAKVSEEKVRGDPVDLNSIHEQTDLESYVRIQEVKRVISRLKEFARSEKQAERIPPDDGKKCIFYFDRHSLPEIFSQKFKTQRCFCFPSRNLLMLAAIGHFHDGVN